MSFIKWAGSKNQLLRQLSDLFPPLKDVRGYCEPFLGSGSVFFYIKSQGYLEKKPIYLSDINVDLIITYKVVKENLNELIPMLTKYQNNHTEELYYKVRDNFHKRLVSNVERASQFIYLNKTGFNGLWRVNSQGINNQSIGHKEKVHIFDANDLNYYSKLLQPSLLGIMSYENIVNLCNEDYFIFLDPPYDNIGEENNASFVGYTSDSFKQKRKLLLNTFRKLDEIGCNIMLSNSATPYIISQFKDYHITTLKAKRICAGDAEKRIPVDEVVITNYKPTKKQFKMSDF